MTTDQAVETNKRTYYWSSKPGCFVNKNTGVRVEGAPSFHGTNEEWNEGLYELILECSNNLFRKHLTLNGLRLKCHSRDICQGLLPGFDPRKSMEPDFQYKERFPVVMDSEQPFNKFSVQLYTDVIVNRQINEYAGMKAVDADMQRLYDSAKSLQSFEIEKLSEPVLVADYEIVVLDFGV